MILYRYLDPGEKNMSIHYVVEPPRNSGDRLHGHAWVTVAGEVLDVEDFSVVHRSSEIFRHPPKLEYQQVAYYRIKWIDRRNSVVSFVEYL
jgi:hypothetical protein